MTHISIIKGFTFNGSRNGWNVNAVRVVIEMTSTSATTASTSDGSATVIRVFGINCGRNTKEYVIVLSTTYTEFTEYRKYSGISRRHTTFIRYLNSHT